MKISSAMAGINRIYIEAAPLIYYVEEHTSYLQYMDAIVAHIENYSIQAISSVISLTEVLAHPLRLGKTELEQEYRDILLNSDTFQLIPVTTLTAESAARLRAAYNLRTPDALHVASAIESGCDAFLTNDLGLRRVKELHILVLNELEL